MTGNVEMEIETLLEMYARMVLIRFFEEAIDKLFAMGRIGGTAHLCIGQEASAVGSLYSASKEDYMISNHRGHGHLLARGVAADRLMAEIVGEKTGYCGGRGGTQHMFAALGGFSATNGITGGGIPIATGIGLAAKKLKKKSVSICFFGDGAINQGVFHESLNMASLWRLPVLYICENNQYAMSTPIAMANANFDLAAKAESYNIDFFHANGMNVIDVYAKASTALDICRHQGRPVLLEIETYRFCGHSKSDPRLYRTKEEESSWKKECPVKNLALRIYENGARDRADKIQRETAGEIRTILEELGFAGIWEESHACPSAQL